MSNARIAIEDHLAPISSIASQVCPNNKKSPPRNGPIPYDEKVMQKMLRTKILKVYEEDQDLLEDVIIENKQAVEMAETYSNILRSMMDSFASIISNNLNMVMKFLASVTIILALPTMLASFFGMNVKIPFETSDHAFAIIVSLAVILCSGGIIILMKKDMF